MLLTKRKLIITSGVLVFTSVSLISVACSNVSNENIIQNSMKLDNKEINYAVLDNFYSWESDQNYQLPVPTVINNSDKLSNFLVSLKYEFLKFHELISGNENEKLKDQISDTIHKIKETYNSEWFKKHTILIDYGDKKGALIDHKVNSWNEKVKIQNLQSISLTNNSIEIVYKKPENLKVNQKFNTVLYELKNSDFNLESSTNYGIKTLWNTTTRKVKIEDREINSSANFTASLYQANHNWSLAKDINNKILEHDSIATTIIKNQVELSSLITESKLLAKNQKWDSKVNEQLQKMSDHFDKNFFSDNILVLVSVNGWVNNFHEGDSLYIEDYNAEVIDNNVEITLYRSAVNVNTELIELSNNPIFNYSTDKFASKRIPSEDSSPDVTLFMAINKNKFRNLENTNSILTVKPLSKDNSL
ncbi:hypothetical protein [Mycoplasmopsis agassizii]|uniref:Lipoprotein n=1 Tax=Mycoplasmopsis agassizii TaxID=33922 RepID=A0ABX4H4R3_9BACT|nr:hypothetical protein [Mycoplasmopsis agassizii]PAF54877.1 hypothetical protein CJF60_04030 [Mycoplasmopsis agassizii]SMC20017.1 hypothetical protein SAMN02745179_00989 [Mycoplasmopsis agassizii]